MTTPRLTDPVNLLRAWLHDPPDKALDIRGHERRTDALLGVILGEEGHGAVGATKDADVVASYLERLPMPTAGREGERAVGLENGLRAVHTLSGHGRALDAEALSPSAPPSRTREILAQLGRDDAWRRFLSVWRALPTRLADEHSDWRSLPADTRQPDHSIWQHMDTAAAFEAAGPGAALLSFSVGPVQSFIAASRTLRDLWAGSLLLSYLTFQAMVPVLESLGPTAFVYPACRGVPAVDQWLLDACKIPASVLGGRPSVDRLLVPAIPNRFVAIVPSEHAKALGDEAVTAARDAWEKIAGKVYDHISDTLGDDAAWAGAWDAQVKGYWEFRSAVLPRKALQENPALRRELLGDRFFGRAEVVSKLRDYIDPSHRPGYLAEQDPVSRWGGDLAILAKIADAQREVAHFSKGSPQSMVPPKCTLMGDFEQIGPAEFSASQRFWEHAQGSLKVGGFRLRRGERLSAIGLIKRFWVPTHLASEWSFQPTETRLDDTATVAARVWLREAGIDVEQERRKNREWNGQWILSATADERDTSDEDGDDPLDLLEADCPLELGNTLREAKKRLKRAPPRYLAVLHFDGDHLGRWLKGELGPTVRACLHPKTLAYFVERGRALGRERDLEALLGTVRPLSPVRHASLSDALLRFSVDAVPRIVADHDGELVYAGGDDVIALLPLERALACANAIRRAYSEEAYMGRNATASAGLSVMHARSSLRGALDAARAAEKAAKGAGRDALGLAVLRRSGEHARVVMPWTGEKGDAVGAFVEALDAQRARFVEGEAGDRWVYKLRAETAVLRGLEDDAFRAEMRRLIGRTEGADATLATQIESLTERYASWWRTRKDAPAGESWQESFCVLVQSASFMARGGDER